MMRHRMFEVTVHGVFVPPQRSSLYRGDITPSPMPMPTTNDCSYGPHFTWAVRTLSASGFELQPSNLSSLREVTCTSQPPWDLDNNHHKARVPQAASDCSSELPKLRPLSTARGATSIVHIGPTFGAPVPLSCRMPTPQAWKLARAEAGAVHDESR